MEEISNINQIGVIFSSIMAILLLVLPRKYAIMPMIMTVLYLPLGLMIMIGPLHFPMFRIMIAIGFIRIVMKKEYDHIQFNPIDISLILYVVSYVTFDTLLWQTSERFITCSGIAYNIIGSYFFFRCLIIDYDDFRTLVKLMAFIIIPATVAVMIEKSTGRNFLSIFGGVPEFSEIRDGKLRCQGSFRSPILLGTFAATTMPYLILLFFKDARGSRNLIIGIVGFICATIIMFDATTSGALMVYIFAIICYIMWALRKYMRAIRWGIIFSLISLHLYMKDPVWFIMARLATLTGGTGWHRSQLIDQWLRHFNEWWLLGTKKTSHWMGGIHLLDRPDDADITNHFIGVSIHGGLIPLILFILIIIYCYKRIGVSLQIMENATIDLKMILWSLGVILSAHIMALFNVAYFDQLIVFYYMPLAVIASLTAFTFNSSANKPSVL